MLAFRAETRIRNIIAMSVHVTTELLTNKTEFELDYDPKKC